MIRGSLDIDISIKELSITQARQIIINAQSAVGHVKTAELFSELLECPVAYQRITLELNEGDRLLIGQYIGERLPEYQEARPDGADLRWLLVCFNRRSTS